MSIETDNIQKVKEIYAAFGRADMLTILNSLSENVDWQMYGPAVIPETGPNIGRKQVEQFFGKIGRDYNFQKFEPREFIAQGDNVVVLGNYSGTVKPTGKTMQAEWAMVFTFQNGKIAKFREYTDTYNLASAFTK